MSGSYPGDPQSAQRWERRGVDPSLPLTPQDMYNGYPAPTVMGQQAQAFAPVAPSKQGDNFAITSLVLGIVSVSLGWLPVCGIVALAPAIIGTVLGCLGLKSERSRALAIAGIILSLIGLALAFMIAI